MLKLIEEWGWWNVLRNYIEEHELPDSVLKALIYKAYCGYRIPDEQDRNRWLGTSMWANVIVVEYCKKRKFSEYLSEWIKEYIIDLTRLNGVLLSNCTD